MSSRVPKRPEPPPDFCLEALNELAEIGFIALGPKGTRRALRALAARIAAQEASPRVVGISEASEKHPLLMAWLQERLSVWLARHG